MSPTHHLETFAIGHPWPASREVAFSHPEGIRSVRLLPLVTSLFAQ